MPDSCVSAVNSFTGSIPTDLSNLPMVTYVDLGSNSLTGTLPPNIGNMGRFGDTMEYFFTDYNFLTGSIPSDITKWRTLNTLDLSGNSLMGPIPANIGNMTRLNFLFLHNNYLTGELPQSVSQLHALQQFFVQSNELVGFVFEVFDTNVQHLLSDLDFSDNQFTGPLPVDLFQLRALISFAAGSNCFTGTLPEKLCNATKLNFLSLDGMNSASSCRNLIFPTMPSIVSTFTRKLNVVGGIPSCLFALPYIQSLHLSGNGIKYSFPAGLEISPRLMDLTLSNNLLSGPIPDSIQYRTWTTLDLSNNRISGTLRTAFPMYDSSSSLSLQVNHLSGNIPASLKYMENISILQGNLFGCSYSESSIPVNDPDAAIYSCGSNAVNIALLVWMIALFLSLSTAGLVFLAVKYEHLNRWPLIARCLREAWLLVTSRWWSVFEEESNKSLRDSPHIRSFVEQLRQWRKVAIHLLLIITLVLLPVFGTVTLYNATLTYEYAFTIAIAFAAGYTAGIVFMVALTGMFIFLTIQIDSLIFGGKMFQKFHMQWTMSGLGDLKIERHYFTQFALLAAVFLLNFVVVVTFDSLYIIATVEANVAIIYLAEVGLAIFKLLWSDVAIAQIITFVSNRSRSYLTRSEVGASPTVTTLDSSAEEKELEARFVMFHLFLILLNNIAFPCLAILVINPNCFYYAFFPSPPVQSIYNYRTCDYSSVLSVNGKSICRSHTIDTVFTTFDPPFQYGYQCSSMFVTNFSNVYIYLFSISCFVVPLLKVCVKILHDSLVPSPPDLEERLSREEGEGKEEEDAGLRRLLHRLLRAATPPILRRLEREVPADMPILFDRSIYIIRMMTMMAVLMTFGVVFAPLAIVICGSIFSYTAYTQLVIGRVLSLEVRMIPTESDRRRISYRQVLNKETEGVLYLMKFLPFVMAPFISLFYSFFIFDSLGAAVGWRAALPLTIVTLCVPLFVFGGMQLYFMVLSFKWFAPEVEERIDVSRSEGDRSTVKSDGGISMSANPLEMDTSNLRHSSLLILYNNGKLSDCDSGDKIIAADYECNPIHKA